MIRVISAFLAFLLGAGYLAGQTPPPVSAFIDPAAFRNPKLSPDGKYFAVIGEQNFTDYLAIFDRVTMQVTPVTKFTGGKLYNYWWKGSDRILMLVQNEGGWKWFRLFDLATKKTRDIHGLQQSGGFLVNPLLDDPDNVLFSPYTTTGVDLYRLNIRTDKSVLLESNPGFVKNWLTDRTGVALAAFGVVDGKWFMRLRAGNAWREVSLGQNRLPDFEPFAVYVDQKRILGIDYAAGDKGRVVVWNPADDTKETIWQSAEVDPASIRAWGDDYTYAREIDYETDRPYSQYFKPADEAIARGINAALPGTFNVIVSTSQDESLMIIEAGSDVLPACYYLLNRANGRLLGLGGAHPDLDPRSLVPSRYFSFRAPDGLLLHGRAYLPGKPDSKPPAIIVFGPSFSGRHWRFYQPYIQLLASRGYAVVEIDHRGVEGYGRSYADAGFQQLGTGIPDDYAAGIEWLAIQHWIDPKRVAVFGDHSAGLLALHTLVRHPDLFAAWINDETPMDTDYVKSESLTYNSQDRRLSVTTLGGDLRAKKYLLSLDPEPLLRQVKVPSFHFYARDTRDNSLLYRGSIAEKYFAKAGLPYVFFKGMTYDASGHIYEDHERKQHDETVKFYSDLLIFLQDHLAEPPVKK